MIYWTLPKSNSVYQKLQCIKWERKSKIENMFIKHVMNKELIPEYINVTCK
jgi:hypothetical protein